MGRHRIWVTLNPKQTLNPKPLQRPNNPQAPPRSLASEQNILESSTRVSSVRHQGLVVASSLILLARQGSLHSTASRNELLPLALELPLPRNQDVICWGGAAHEAARDSSRHDGTIGRLGGQKEFTFGGMRLDRAFRSTKVARRRSNLVLLARQSFLSPKTLNYNTSEVSGGGGVPSYSGGTETYLPPKKKKPSTPGLKYHKTYIPHTYPVNPQPGATEIQKHTPSTPREEPKAVNPTPKPQALNPKP